MAVTLNYEYDGVTGLNPGQEVEPGSEAEQTNS